MGKVTNPEALTGAVDSVDTACLLPEDLPADVRQQLAGVLGDDDDAAHWQDIADRATD